VISAIFSLSERKPLLAVCELVSNVFHVFSLVAAKVSNDRFACSMLTLINSRRLHERVIGHAALLSSLALESVSQRLRLVVGLPLPY